MTEAVCSSSATPAVPSFMADPAFAKLSDLNHAEFCEQKICKYPSCAETKFLLRHVDRCGKETCKYQDCSLARIVLAHAGSLQHDSPDCPLCKKRDIWKKLIPGKGPRAEESDEEEENGEEDNEDDDFVMVEEENAESVQGTVMDVDDDVIMIDQEAPLDPDLALKRERMEQIVHAQFCRWDYCCKWCFRMKEVLTHIKGCCEWNCERPGCQITKELLYHYRNCRPVDAPCELCQKKPDPSVYSGPDYFADMNPQVLRQICGLLDEPSLKSLMHINKRVNSFFNLAGEIKGFYGRQKFDVLRIEQTAKGSLLLHIKNCSNRIVTGRHKCNCASEGYIHVIDTDGSSDRLRYTKNKREAAEAHVEKRYGWLNHYEAKCTPVKLTAQFYEAIAVALQKFTFSQLFLGSVIFDPDFLRHCQEDQNTFFINMRNSKFES